MDGQNAVTAAGDETVRFWKVFPAQKFSEKVRKNNKELNFLETNIFDKIASKI